VDRRRVAHELRQPLAAAEMHMHLLAGRLAALGLAADDPAREHAQVVGEQLRALALALDQAFDEAAPETSRAATDESPLQGALIALVEDDDAVRLALQTVLQQAGAYVMAAASGPAALAQLADADRMPDLILTDWRLESGGDGRAVIEALRQRCFGRTLPAFVLTAFERDAASALAGVARVQVLRKPVATTTLLAQLAAALNLPPLGDADT
jgi:CheY-like chemotaxis protein